MGSLVRPASPGATHSPCLPTPRGPTGDPGGPCRGQREEKEVYKTIISVFPIKNHEVFTRHQSVIRSESS